MDSQKKADSLRFLFFACKKDPPISGRSLCLFVICVDSVRNSLCHLVSVILGCHQTVLGRIAHEAKLNDRDRNGTPVDAAHGIGVNHIAVLRTGVFAECCDHLLGELLALADHITGKIRISAARCHRECSVNRLVRISVRVYTHENVCSVLRGKFCTLGVADIDVVRLADHVNIVAALLKDIAYL